MNCEFADTVTSPPSVNFSRAELLGCVVITSPACTIEPGASVRIEPSAFCTTTVPEVALAAAAPCPCWASAAETLSA